MPTGVGRNTRYTEEEKREKLSSLKNYKTLKEAATALGLPLTTLQRWRKKYGLFDRAKKKKQKHQQNLLEKSLKYKNAHEAARHLSVNACLLGRIQKRAGVYETRKKKYSETERKKYAKESAQYETILEASQALGIRHTTLLKWRLNNGVRSPQNFRKDNRYKYTDAQRLYFAQESAKYESIAQAVDSLGIPTSTLRVWCKKFGVPIKRSKKTYSQAEKQECLNSIQKGTSILSISREKNISYASLYKWKKPQEKKILKI